VTLEWGVFWLTPRTFLVLHVQQRPTMSDCMCGPSENIERTYEFIEQTYEFIEQTYEFVEQTYVLDPVRSTQSNASPANAGCCMSRLMTAIV
jgi:hypothetical protein